MDSDNLNWWDGFRRKRQNWNTALPKLVWAEEARGAHWSWDGGVGKTEGKKEKTTTTSGSYSSARSARNRHAACSPRQREAKGGRRRAWKAGERTPAVRRWRPVVILIFEIFTDLPLRLFFKLLPNFLKKLKISKNESCSTFQTLQLCFKEYFQILPLFWNLNLGCIWAFESFQNYSKFYM